MYIFHFYNKFNVCIVCIECICIPPLVKEINFTDLYGYIYIYHHKMNKKITDYEK